MALYLREQTWWYEIRDSAGRIRESTGTGDLRKAKVIFYARLAEHRKLRELRRLGAPVPVDELVDARMSIEKFVEKYRDSYLAAGGTTLRKSRERSWRADHFALDHLAAFLAKRGVAQVGKVQRHHAEGFKDWRLSTPISRPVSVTLIRWRGGLWLRYKLRGRVLRERVPAEDEGRAEDLRRAKEKEVTELAKRLPSGATVNHDLRVCHAAFSWAKDRGYVAANPFAGVKAVKTPRADPRNLGELEVKRLLEAARAERFVLFGLFATAIFAGLRLAELLALEWTDVRFAERRIRVRCDETFRTKSRKPRNVPLPDELAAILEPIKSTIGLCFPSGGQDERGRPTPLDPDNVRKILDRVVKRAGLENVSPHDLRRTYASILAKRGVAPSRIRDYLGHESVATTESYYILRDDFDLADVDGLRFGVAPPARDDRETA